MWTWSHSGQRVRWRSTTLAVSRRERERVCARLRLRRGGADFLPVRAPAGVRKDMPIVKLVDAFIGKFDVVANEGSIVTIFVRMPAAMQTYAAAPPTQPHGATLAVSSVTGLPTRSQAHALCRVVEMLAHGVCS